MAIRRYYTVGGPWLPGPHPREISFQIWQFIHPYLLILISQMASTIQAIDIERGGKCRRFDNVSGDVTNNLLLLTPQMDFAVAISYIPFAFWSFLIFHWADWKWATFLLLVYIRSKSGGSNRLEINHPKLHIIRIIATLGTYKNVTNNHFFCCLNIQETQPSLTSRARHLCKYSGVVAPSQKHVGRSGSNRVGINKGTKNWSVLRPRPLVMGT